MTQVEIETRNAGVQAFRDGMAYSPYMPKQWRNGWVAARNEKLRAKRYASRPLGAPAPLIDMAKLERMRMGGR